MTKLQSLLAQPYSEAGEGAIVEAIFSGRYSAFSKRKVEAEGDELLEVTRAGQIACDDSGGKRIEVLSVRIVGDLSLRRNRAGLRKKVDSYYNAVDEVAGLLAFFHKDGEEAWRLSYAYKRPERNEKGKIVAAATETTRCSYVLGSGAKVHTPAQRLDKLGTSTTLKLAQVEEAFSVEAVGESFFDEYKGFYERFVMELGKPRNKALFGFPHGGELDLRSPEAKPLRDFAKKLLGRLVFLKFLEKKGWLGASDFEKADGRPDFLLDLFKTYRADFYPNALVPLFFDTLNRPRKGDLFGLTDSKVPYLNGGLFEPEYGVEEVNKGISIPGSLFQELFDFLDHFNFTVDEHDEGEAEIGVDPEMLGRIFERLIEDNEKDMNGTVYTPYAVVEYMCRNSLHLHLCRTLGCEREDERGQAIKKLLVSRETKPLGKRDLSRIEEAAKDIKVLDPAVGSGAFPLGMLKELVSLREALAEAQGESANRGDLKREIIRSSLYGVDIDSGAVDIARLRLFLALVVDSSLPEPLPNLDFKILQGDSLSEAWEEVPIVFDAKEYRKHPLRESDGLFETGELERLNQRKRKSAAQILKESGKDVLAMLDGYYDPSSSPEAKHESKAMIEELELYTVEQALIHELAARKSARQKAELECKRDPKESKKKSLAKAEAAVADAERKLSDFAELVQGSLREKPYFLWHYYFHDAFESGGFDIIIGNPPYRAMQENAGDNAQNKKYPLIDARVRESFVKTSAATNNNQIYDLFVRFMRMTMDFALQSNRNTIIALITNYAYIVKSNFDGLRASIRESFGNTFIVNLGGDVRSNPRLSGPINNIFGIQAGVAISIVEKARKGSDGFRLFYAATKEEERREEKIVFLDSDKALTIQYKQIIPDARQNWINQSDTDFAELIALCSDEGKRGIASDVIFELYSCGVKSNRDDWVYSFEKENVKEKIRYFIHVYNKALNSYDKSKSGKPDDFYDTKIKWARELTHYFKSKTSLLFDEEKISCSLYRPFVRENIYFGKELNEMIYQVPRLFSQNGEKLNTVICLCYGDRLGLNVISTKYIPCLDIFSPGQAINIPIIRYDSDSKNDNITDWSLTLFREHFKDSSITKEDIFHYVYGVLHNPAYRTKYAIDLKRDYPRVPLYKDFKKWGAWGKALMDRHINFEEQPEATGIGLFPGDGVARKSHQAEYTKDADGHRLYSGSVRFSDGSVLRGIDPRSFDYRLGNRSAIEWVLDQYSEKHWPSDADIAAGKAKPLREDEKVLRDKFNAYRFADYKDYVVSLIKRLQTISLATLDIQDEMSREEDHGMDMRSIYGKIVKDEELEMAAEGKE